MISQIVMVTDLTINVLMCDFFHFSYRPFVGRDYTGYTGIRHVRTVFLVKTNAGWGSFCNALKRSHNGHTRDRFFVSLRADSNLLS